MSFICLWALGLIVAIPGMVLLNQQHRWVEVDFTIYHIDVYGTSISTETAFYGSVVLGLIAWLGALIAARKWIVCQSAIQPDSRKRDRKLGVRK